MTKVSKCWQTPEQNDVISGLVQQYWIYWGIQCLSLVSQAIVWPSLVCQAMRSNLIFSKVGQ